MRREGGGNAAEFSSFLAAITSIESISGQSAPISSQLRIPAPLNESIPLALDFFFALEHVFMAHFLTVTLHFLQYLEIAGRIGAIHFGIEWNYLHR